MVRIGIVGVGARAGAHIAALRRLPGAQITALVDPVLERAERAAAEVGGRAFGTVDDIWDLVDAVWVCTPHDLHHQPTIAAARQGKHVYVEKPMAHTLDAADAMLAACRQAEVKLMVGKSLRFFPELRAMRALAEQGTLGDLTAVWSRRLSSEDPNDMVSRRRDSRVGGGFTMGNGSHELDFVRWIAEGAGGRPVRVAGALGFPYADMPHLDAVVRATVWFDTGTVGGLDGGYGFPLGGATVRVAAGTRGMAVADGSTLRLRLRGQREDQQVDVTQLTSGGPDGLLPGENHTTSGNRAFLRAIAEDREPFVPGEAGRASLALCVAVHRSAREKRDISVGADS